MSKWKTVENFESELLRDRAFRRDFEELEPEYRIAREILAARQAIGMSQQALAQAIGTSQSRISQWERGEELPRLDNLQKVADATGASLNISIEPTGQSPAARSHGGGRTQETRRGGTSSTTHGSMVRKATGRKATGRKKRAGRKARGRKKTAGRKISAARKSTTRRTTVRKTTTGRKKIAGRKSAARRTTVRKTTRRKSHRS